MWRLPPPNALSPAALKLRAQTTINSRGRTELEAGLAAHEAWFRLGRKSPWQGSRQCSVRIGLCPATGFALDLCQCIGCDADFVTIASCARQYQSAVFVTELELIHHCLWLGLQL